MYSEVSDNGGAALQPLLNQSAMGEFNVRSHQQASIKPDLVSMLVSSAKVWWAGLFSWLFFAAFPALPQPMPPQEPTGPCPTAEVRPGLVVESTAKNSEGERAGLAAGDVILSWTRGASGGELRSPFDLAEVEREQAPRGPVALESMRNGAKRATDIGPGTWAIQTRPNFVGSLLIIYNEALGLAQAGKLDDAVVRWRAAAGKSRTGDCSWLASWLLFRAAQALAADKQRWKESDALYQEAVDAAPPPAHAKRVQLLLTWAEGLRLRGDLENARNHYQQALNEAQQVDPQSPTVAETLSGLGVVAYLRSDFDQADNDFRQALEIQERGAPQSIPVAKILNRLGAVSGQRGEPVKGEEYFLRALEIDQVLTPGSPDVAAIENNLGNLALARGDLAEAEKYYQQALEKSDPKGPFAAQVFNNLGILEEDRRNLDRAEDYHQKALEIKQKVAAGSPSVAISLNNLGEVERDRGNLDQAEDYFRQAVAIRKEKTPDSLEMATCLNNLGEVAHARGDLAGAKDLFQQALKIRESRAPGSLDVAWNLTSLGDLARDSHNLIEASQDYLQALDIRMKLAPGSTLHAESLAALAGVACDQGQEEQAAQYYGQAIDVLENQVARLGGSGDIRAGFRANHAHIYSEYADLLLSKKQPSTALAFEIVERSRARTLLESLTDARVSIRQGADPSLLEKERALEVTLRAKLKRKFDLFEGKHTEKQVADFTQEINELLSQYQELEGRIRFSSPNYAALTQPQTLGAQEVQQQLLDAETVLIEYSLGEKHSFVFLVTPTSLEFRRLPERAVIEGSARQVYGLLTSRNRRIAGETSSERAKRLARNQTEYQRAAAALSQMVLSPFAARLGKKRLLIVADGALEFVPFKALPIPSGDVSKPAPERAPPLITEHEIVSLPSASVLASLRREARDRQAPPQEVAVLADPVFDKEDPRVGGAVKPSVAVQPVAATRGSGGEWQTSRDEGGPALRAPEPREAPGGNEAKPGAPDSAELTRSLADVGPEDRQAGTGLTRLVFSRREADAIMRVTDAGKGMEATDFRASRETALSADLRRYRYVHFATHGVVDNEHPELSGLVLSMVDQAGKPQDGFLDLADVYNLTLPADLVVLSACETALGKQITGEGLVGLTRGFMYAGATRVVASLWSVNDEATADLMGRFYYGMLKKGLTPAAALRKAQIEVREQKRWADPYYWAAFTIQGQWK